MGTGPDAASESTPARTVQRARHEASHVAGDIADQARRVARDTGDRVAQRVDSQGQQWSKQLIDVSHDLRSMAEQHQGSPAAMVVEQLADRTTQVAGYLSEHGVRDVLTEVKDFARRRPGTFLLAMAAAGFLAGRLGKSAAAATGEGETG